MARSNQPVSSFGPELMAVLRAGSESRKTFDFPDPKAAFRFMSRVNALRAAMRREAHPDTDRTYRAGLKIDKDNRCRVIVEPRDSEFSAILKASDIELSTILKQEAPTPRPGHSEDSADSFLSSLTSDKIVDTGDK